MGLLGGLCSLKRKSKQRKLYLSSYGNYLQKKSADILSFRNSFITISIVNQSTFFVQCVKARPLNRPSLRLPVLGHKKPRSLDCWVGWVV